MKYSYPMAEYLRPWKLITLAAGLIFLFAGARWSGLPDWDFPISILMGLAAYLTAAPSMRVVLERRWEYAHYAAFWTWFSVDGIYVIYWGTFDPETLATLRPANAAASLALYIMCGLIWHSKQSVVAESLHH